MNSTKKIRIGGGAGFAEDRVDHAVELIERGNIDYICFDSLSENELSQVTIHKLSHPEDKGYDLQLEKRMTQIMPAAMKHKVKVIGNMGSTNPVAAAEYVAELTKKLGYTGIKIAAVVGDNVRDFLLKGKGINTVEENKPVNEFGDRLVAANAYIPCTCIEEALKNGADVVLTGRVGDSGMFLGALRYEFGWKSTDWDKLALGIMCGHQCECAGQVCGGYYADPPYRDVPDLHKLGFPIVEVHDNGDVYFTKVEGTGGIVTVDTCKEQAIYEVHDPSKYMHAEVTVDLTHAKFEQVGKDLVKMTGVKGTPAPEKLKAALGVSDGYFTETYVWYGGPGARARAEVGRDMLYKRFEFLGYKPDALVINLMGIDGMYGNAPGVPINTDPWEVGVRMAVRGQDRQELVYMIAEATSDMSTNGPAAVSCMNSNYSIREVVKYFHAFVPREAINIQISYLEV